MKPQGRLAEDFEKLLDAVHFLAYGPYFTQINQLHHILWLILDELDLINVQIIFSDLLKVVKPNWDYFVHAPLEEGLVRFETKTERALYANVVASEANWMESQSCERLIVYLRARQDLESFREGFKAKGSQFYKSRYS